ncbi:MAG: ABC transporter substrate-binding protein [Chloroflexi bacterium]|nr:ABC transporter substrate-binding protein [Chloroflexota bacterium]
MLKKRLARLLCISIVVVMLVLPFMSCGDKKVEETVTYTLKIGTVSQPTTNNPFAIGIGASDAEHMQMLYEPLVRVMFSSDPVPQLAKSWSYDAATMTWTIKLNPDAKFSDGSKVTAQDVEWTLEKQVELKLGLVSNLITVLGTATDNPNPINATDSETVTVKLKTFAATFIRYLGNTSIVPKAIWEGMTNEALAKYANPDPVGSGPYKLKERVENSHVIYTARPDYWGGKPPIDTIQLLWYATNEGQLLAIKAGDIDAISVFSLATAVPQLLGNPDITVFQVASNTTVTLYPNHRFAPWNLVAFRKAASLAINRQDQITYAVSGWGTVPAMVERDPAFADVQAILKYNRSQ